MEAKEKAKELLNKMDVIHYMKLGGKNSDSKGLPVSMHDSQVKKCALISVQEILNVLFKSHEINYWKEVKQELEKL